MRIGIKSVICPERTAEEVHLNESVPTGFEANRMWSDRMEKMYGSFSLQIFFRITKHSLTKFTCPFTCASVWSEHE